MYKLAVAGHPQQTRTVVVKEKETERGKYISQSVSQSIRSATLSLPEEGNRQRTRTTRRCALHKSWRATESEAPSAAFRLLLLPHRGGLPSAHRAQAQGQSISLSEANDTRESD